MGRHAKITLRRGNDVFAVHDAKVVDRLLFEDGCNMNAEDCITKLHKAALERVEKALRAQFKVLAPLLHVSGRTYRKKTAASLSG